ncbi:unnamed protein product [Caretta caretta]
MPIRESLAAGHQAWGGCNSRQEVPEIVQSGSQAGSESLFPTAEQDGSGNTSICQLCFQEAQQQLICLQQEGPGDEST